MNQAREHDHQDDDAQESPLAIAEIELTPLEKTIWQEATALELPGERAEDWTNRKDDRDGEDNANSDDPKERERALLAENESRAREAWPQWQWRFLSTLRQMAGVLSLACRATAISPSTVAKARARCKYFDSAVVEALQGAVDRVEAALHVSAVIGDVKPVYQGGIRVGHERRKDIRAAEAILKAKRPNEWRPDGGNQVAISLALPTGDAVAEAMARLTAPEVPALECGTLKNEPASVEKA